MHSFPSDSGADWKAQLAASFTRPEDLLSFLNIPPDAVALDATAALKFPFKVSLAYAERMVRGDRNDPLLRQVLPLAEEAVALPGYSADPVGDLQAVAVPGLLHKYQGRALLLTTGACAIHCRYCFRREFPYAEAQLTHSRQRQALDYVTADTSISELILSGGDPLVLDDSRLGELFRAIGAIPHIKRLRIHTRLPIMLPARITPNLLEILAHTRLSVVMVIHANHAQEMDAAVGQALNQLSQAGVVLLNQAVLLGGVNDSEEALVQLGETLIEFGVLPYYLHVLDKANGTGHFEVEEYRVKQIWESLRRQLPGYLVPRLVREISGEPYKTMLYPDV